MFCLLSASCYNYNQCDVIDQYKKIREFLSYSKDTKSKGQDLFLEGLNY